MTDFGKIRVAWLEAFVAIAESGNQLSAATDLGIDQPTISRYVQNLEFALGTKLVFEKSTQLLQAGKDFKPVAEDVLKLLMDARKSLAPPPPQYGPPIPTKNLRVPPSVPKPSTA